MQTLLSMAPHTSTENPFASKCYNKTLLSMPPQKQVQWKKAAEDEH